MSTTFPEITLADWRQTRDTLQGYARVLSKLREALTPSQRHWRHVSLRVSVRGLWTPAIATPEGAFDVGLDLVDHLVAFSTSGGRHEALPLAGQPATEVLDWVVEQAGRCGADPQMDRDRHSGIRGPYDRAAVGAYRQALARSDAVLRSFGGELREATAPVQFFAHHFDLSLLWFSGRRVPGVDPDDEENADEQMNFGFSTGDELVPEAYCYATAYPLPEELPGTEMPPGAHWHDLGFRGAVLPYREVAGENGEERLRAFLSTLQQAGAKLMTG